MMKPILIILFIAISAASCKKSEETLTLLGNWEVDSYRANGVDKTTEFKSTYLDYLIKYDASNNYIETYKIAGVNQTFAGSWVLTNGGDDFELTNQVDQTKRYFHIEELNPSSATITEDSGNKSYNLRRI